MIQLDPLDPRVWYQKEAIALCVEIESFCPAFGCHVALTGGLLYKEGPRKDCDLVFYRIRQRPQINMEGLFEALKSIGLVATSGRDWCFKATYQGKNVDMFFPEEHVRYLFRLSSEPTSNSTQ